MQVRIARLVRSIIEPVCVGHEIYASEELRDVLTELEYVASEQLRIKYPAWKYEGLDGVFLARATRSGPESVDLWGFCILISSQTVAPIHFQISLSPGLDEIERLECNVGEAENEGRIKSSPFPRNIDKSLHALSDRIKAITWAYTVELVGSDIELKEAE